jgi:hypothetical protein
MKRLDSRDPTPLAAGGPAAPAPATAAAKSGPEIQAVREALRAILFLKKAVEADETGDRLELWRRAEAALYESAWQTRRAVGRELHGTPL